MSAQLKRDEQTRLYHAAAAVLVSESEAFTVPNNDIDLECR